MHWGGLLLLAAGARVGWAGAVTGSSSNWDPLFRVPFIRVPYYTGDRKRDPNLENYPVVS